MCGTTLWRYHHCHELMLSHPRACESLVRARTAEPSPRLVLSTSQAVPGLVLFLSVECEQADNMLLMLVQGVITIYGAEPLFNHLYQSGRVSKGRKGFSTRNDSMC